MYHPNCSDAGHPHRAICADFFDRLVCPAAWYLFNHICKYFMKAEIGCPFFLSANGIYMRGKSFEPNTAPQFSPSGKYPDLKKLCAHKTATKTRPLPKNRLTRITEPANRAGSG